MRWWNEIKEAALYFNWLSNKREVWDIWLSDLRLGNRIGIWVYECLELGSLILETAGEWNGISKGRMESNDKSYYRGRIHEKTKRAFVKGDCLTKMEILAHHKDWERTHLQEEWILNPLHKELCNWFDIVSVHFQNALLFHAPNWARDFIVSWTEMHFERSWDQKEWNEMFKY